LFGRGSEEEPPPGEAGIHSLIARLRRKPMPSDRYRLLQKEAARKIARDRDVHKAVQGTLPT
jgi:adenylate kinase